MTKVGVVGGTGYTGVELLRLLVMHPQVELAAVTSRAEQGIPVSQLYPNLRGHTDLRFVEPSLQVLSQCDLVFFATPNGIAMRQVPELLAAGVKVIDLAADFRLKDPAQWADWYGMEHACVDLLAEAVYGLPEVNRSEIAGARLVANPGCYPTAVQLGFLPLIEAGLVNSSDLVADTKSGVSGAGRQAAVGSLLCEASESLKAYGVAGHRHQPEIEQGLTAISRDNGHNDPVELTFVPHLTPMIRGIHATLYAELTVSEVDLQALYQQRYSGEPFVDVMPAGSLPETRSVRGANMCRLSVFRPQGRKRVVVLSVIDNLVKGAAGQAIQNMNIMFGFAETAGLDMVAMMP